MYVHRNVLNSEASCARADSLKEGSTHSEDIQTSLPRSGGAVFQSASREFQANLAADVSPAKAKIAPLQATVESKKIAEKPNMLRKFSEEVVPLAAVATLFAGPFASVSIMAFKALATGVIDGTALSAGGCAVAGLLGVFCAYCATGISLVSFKMVREPGA